MADQKKEDELDDSGLGNLPPLSDFDSQSGFGDAGSLPPISGFDSGGGLPPLSDLESGPGGARSSGPMDFDSGPTALDTPTPRRGSSGGFQDIAADSDFSPETPEIGPGPDSNVDTPMFDSAFGGADQDFDMASNTPAPTQAMETPMFGDQGAFGGSFGGAGASGGGGGFGFDDNAFAGGGTPAPDFTADTGMRGPAAPFKDAPVAAPPPAKKRGGGLAILLAAVIFLIIGLVAAPYLSDYLTFLPNPTAQKLRDAEQQVSSKDARIAQLESMVNSPNAPKLTPEEAERLTAEISQKNEQLTQLTAQAEEAATSLSTQQENLRLVEEDLANKSEEYALAQQAYEDLQNEMAIVQARQRGLATEVERLTGLVGGLDDANARRTATKEAMQHNVDRLLIQIREALPLTPAKYSHDARVAAVEAFQDKVSDAKWVTPELMQEYTSLYVRELEIGQQEEYFYANMPVIDQYGTHTTKWSEALMLGNRAVYFRSLDGKNIGMYANAGTAESPRWIVQEIEDKNLRAGIEARIFQSRVPGFEDKVHYLAERELDERDGSNFQRAFSSL